MMSRYTKQSDWNKSKYKFASLNTENVRFDRVTHFI